MIITYDVSTPNMAHARDIALRRAKAEGWGNATIVSLMQVDQGLYSVTLTVRK